MWNTDQLGIASWQSEGSIWRFDARGGEHGIGMLPTDDASSVRRLSLSSVDQDRLPVAAEQFIRGDHWNVNYPQVDGSFALRLAFCPIQTTADRLVLEVCLSIQTDLLDTNPKIDIDVTCDDIDSFVPGDAWGSPQVQGSGCAPISLAKSKQESLAVLLGPHDGPFTTNLSTDSLLRLRLFGEFLEKGVIRKGRPWIVIDRSGNVPSESDLVPLWDQLCSSPLPLTP
ncbi:hypothetical protein K227x_21430 [Rubripirellula lacrimiformis]|uniref:Uncharacterized protein n=1 Tax=Rubripirellula lacrimiformis TaxID=1930273 RepID=A0A517N9S8_9BACT|nr:hypothetical protein [Rubripirellula lacrimiformis]QDT03758.1 hypothetical protein K227x_21430 [Rubripirellula lacrimiformis]